MSEDNDLMLNETSDNDTDTSKAELESLKKKADLIGVKYSPNIGLDTLRERVREKLSESQETTTESSDSSMSKGSLRNTLRKEARKLVRIRVTCRNPHKKEWEGEIFTVANSMIGTVKRFIPFGVEWHVESILYNLLKQKQYQKFYWEKHPKTGQRVRKGKLEQEFDITVLPALTKKELEELKAKQQLAAAAE